MTIRAVLIVNNHGKPRLTKFYSQLPSARQQALIRLIYRLVSKRPDGVCNFLDAPELTPLLPPNTDVVSFSAAGSTGRSRDRAGNANGSSSSGNVRGTTTTSTAAASSTFASSSSASHGSNSQDDLRVIYRHYATLYFVFVVDQSESELGILDLIQARLPTPRLLWAHERRSLIYIPPLPLPHHRIAAQVFVESLDRCFENVCELDLIFHFDEVHAILSEVIQGGLVVETNIHEIVAAAQTTSRARKASLSTSASGGALASLTTSAASLSSSLTPSSLSHLNIGFPTPTASGSGTTAPHASNWPSGTFVVDALSNLGSQYWGARGRRR